MAVYRSRMALVAPQVLLKMPHGAIAPRDDAAPSNFYIACNKFYPYTQAFTSFLFIAHYLQQYRIFLFVKPRDQLQYISLRHSGAPGSATMFIAPDMDKDTRAATCTNRIAVIQYP